MVAKEAEDRRDSYIPVKDTPLVTSFLQPGPRPKGPSIYHKSTGWEPATQVLGDI